VFCILKDAGILDTILPFWVSVLPSNAEDFLQ